MNFNQDFEQVLWEVGEYFGKWIVKRIWKYSEQIFKKLRNLGKILRKLQILKKLSWIAKKF